MRGWRGPHRAEIVLGTNTSADDRRAVEFAVREATLRDADLVALMSIAGDAPAGSTAGVSTGRIPAAEHRLRHFLASVGTGGVDVTMVVTTRPAADALVDRARSAELLVLGAPAESVSAPGSVSRRCLDSAQCPVTVVPPARARRPAADRPNPTQRRASSARRRRGDRGPSALGVPGHAQEDRLGGESHARMDRGRVLVR
jgi:nucleotide-binding universal stress UspA family protein